MPKEKQADGTVKVQFKTKDGKTVEFARRGAKKAKKETPAPAEAAAQPTQPSASSSSSGQGKKQKQNGERDRPTDLQPVLVLTDD